MIICHSGQWSMTDESVPKKEDTRNAGWVKRSVTHRCRCPQMLSETGSRMPGVPNFQFGKTRPRADVREHVQMLSLAHPLLNFDKQNREVIEKLKYHNLRLIKTVVCHFSKLTP